MAISFERAEILRQEYKAVLDGHSVPGLSRHLVDASVILDLLNEIEQLKYSSD